MSRILIATNGPQDWRRALADPATQWRDGFSAKAVARSWEHAQAVPPEIAALLGRQVALQLAIAEHKVALPGGQAASQCDVFALLEADGQQVAMTVEAKVDEPFGPLLGDWRKGASAGKAARLAAICAVLDLPDPPDALRYQLFHRTAAAVLEARRFRRPVAAMVVQSFSPTSSGRADFDAFARYAGLALPATGMATRRLPCGTELRLGWAAGDPAFLRPDPASAPAGTPPARGRAAPAPGKAVPGRATPGNAAPGNPPARATQGNAPAPAAGARPPAKPPQGNAAAKPRAGTPAGRPPRPAPPKGKGG